jgi:hypothetical protein
MILQQFPLMTCESYVVTTNLFSPQEGIVMWIGSPYAEAPFFPR